MQKQLACILGRQQVFFDVDGDDDSELMDLMRNSSLNTHFVNLAREVCCTSAAIIVFLGFRPWTFFCSNCNVLSAVLVSEHIFFVIYKELAPFLIENGRYGHAPIRSDTSIRVYTTADTDTSTPCVMVSH